MKINDNGSWLLEGNVEEHAYMPRMSNILLSLVEKYNPKLIYDFGCGYGSYIKDINSTTGIEAIGFEAHPDHLIYPNIQAQDLSKSFVLDRKADMVISLEVGEHIPEQFEQIFIDNICNNASEHIVLSWAIVGQPGDGHINCKNNDYIVSELAKRGFKYDSSSNRMRDHEDLLWFKNTFMVFHKN